MKTPSVARNIRAFFLMLIAVGCATPYQPEQIGAREHLWMLAYGGYSNTRIDANTENVSFTGNGFTPRRTVELYLLYRCAEVTSADGYDYFLPVDSNTDATQSAIATPSTFEATTVASGNSLATRATYFPGSTLILTFYGAQTVIKMFKGHKPQDLLAYDAGEVLEYMGPSIGKNDGPPAHRSESGAASTVAALGASSATTPVVPALQQRYPVPQIDPHIYQPTVRPPAVKWTQQDPNDAF